jgi:hypothetical protein
MLDAGVELACYWPLRCNGRHEKKALLNSRTKRPTANFQVLQLFAEYTHPQRAASVSTDAGLYHFATRDADGRAVTLVLVNRSSRPRPAVNLTTPGFSATRAWAITLTAPQPQSDAPSQTTANLPDKGDGWEVAVPAWSMVVVQLKTDKTQTANHKAASPGKSWSAHTEF